MSQNNEMNDSKRSILLGMWKKVEVGERDVSYERFYLAMHYIVEALEVMNGTHADINQLDETYSKGWSTKINKKLPRIYMYCPISILSLV